MREIKFRAWDSISKKMHEDVCSHNAKNFKVNESEQKWFIMQFTELKDKNGKEIYEGDIVEVQEHYEHDSKIPQHELKVVFMEASFCLCHLELPGDQYVMELHENVINNRVEVIGNIYENPELIDAVGGKDE